MIFRKILLISAIAISSCREPAPVIYTAQLDRSQLPSISKQFACLPQEAAFIAAHRGTARNASLAENSALSLQALILKGYLFAEIDISSIKDGTHVLFHDGKWDDKSTGTGIVVATPRSVFETISLRDTEGLVRSDKPPKFTDYLKIARNNIYLEIDFKSSANYETVIAAIRNHGMADQVILIAYNSEQAKRLANLAPEMMISASAKTDSELKQLESDGVSLDKIAVWRGKSAANSNLLKILREKGVPVLRLAPKSNLEASAKVASLLVTDYAFDFEPIIGLTKKSKADYEACINN